MPFYKVILEVYKRKYKPREKEIHELLRKHRCLTGLSLDDISIALNLPKTQIEHYFRTDTYSSLPSPEEWLKLKEILHIQTTEYDAEIMTMIAADCNFDTTNRIHYGECSPTLTATSEKTLYLVKEENK